MNKQHYGFTNEELDFIMKYDTCLPAGRLNIAWGERVRMKHE